MFIFDEEGGLIGHYNAHLLGQDLSGPLGTDAEGYKFGPEMLAVTGDGAWVTYVYNNPPSDIAGDDHVGACTEMDECLTAPASFAARSPLVGLQGPLPVHRPTRMGVRNVGTV